jgi:Fe-S-cluster-containing dehydrogenase component
MNITRKGFLRLSGVAAAFTAARRVFGAPPRRWGMAIDVAKCLQQQGCTKCIEACDRAHNIPVFRDPRREVKWIWKARYEDAFSIEPGAHPPDALRGKLLPVLCNHCDDPPCVRVCPTQATWKREDGIVMMDWHRCIGCRYCVAACPYGSRSFNWTDPRPAIPVLNPDYPTRTKGVVEKCTLCEERLAKGRLPACVEVCPAKAIVFGDLNDAGSPLRELLRNRYAIERKPELGTRPSIFYIM